MYHAYEDLASDALAALYAFPPRPALRATMVASADGAAWLAGVSAGLSSEADRTVFALNRALADVILVGAGTVRTEGYRPARVRDQWRHLRAGRAATPPIAVLTARLDLDLASPLLAAAPPDARTIVITTERASPELRARATAHADVIVAGERTVDPAEAVRALRARGHQRILCEGGPAVLAQLTAAGLTDELCLTVGPLLAGPGAARILSGTAWPAAVPMRLAHIVDADGFLLLRYVLLPAVLAVTGGTCCYRRYLLLPAVLAVIRASMRTPRRPVSRQGLPMLTCQSAHRATRRARRTRGGLAWLRSDSWHWWQRSPR